MPCTRSTIPQFKVGLNANLDLKHNDSLSLLSIILSIGNVTYDFPLQLTTKTSLIIMFIASSTHSFNRHFFNPFRPRQRSEDNVTESNKRTDTSSLLEEADEVEEKASSVEKAVGLLLDDVEKHQNHQLHSFDLVASNTFCSTEIKKIMCSGLINSYCIGLPGNRFYGGCRVIDKIECKTRELVCQVFGAKYCEVQFLSGMMANIAAYNVLLPQTGCTVMASPSKHGGHYSHNTKGPLTRLFGANVVQTPWDEHTYNVDVDALPLAMATHKPCLLILGWSEMLFEHDLPAIRKICDEHSCKIMYDMSHVAGLVAGGVFQSDMMQYADIVTSSTGKSLHAADHGLILYNDPSFTPKIRESVIPLLTSNTHFHETAALCMAMLEVQNYGSQYGVQVVANTKALGKELDKRGFKLLCADIGYSNSHELIIDLEGESGVQRTRLLDAAGVFVNPQDLPWDTVTSGPTGLRLGTQVLTRRGFRERHMVLVADALARVLKKHESVTSVSRYVAKACSRIGSLDFAFA